MKQINKKKQSILKIVLGILLICSNLTFFPQHIVTAQNRANELSFQVERKQNTAQIKNLNIPTSYNYYADMIEIKTPTNVTISGFGSLLTPSGWGTSFQNSSTEEYNSYSFLPNKKSDVATITNFLQNLTFNISNPVDKSGQIEIILNDQTITSFVHPDGKIHYYEFIPKSSVGSFKDWFQAYNYAKSRTYRGLTGYLATLTSQAEQDFVYKNIAKNPGWLGGTRATLSNKTKLNDQSDIPTNILDYEVRPAQATEWYWATGPEAGQIFFDKATYASGGKTPSGSYSYFTNPTNVFTLKKEPNAESMNSSYEAFLQFALEGKPYWNDLAYNWPWSVEGYYIEYSEYGTQKEVNNTGPSGAADIPQPIIVSYKNSKGDTLKPDKTFGSSNYSIGTILLNDLSEFTEYDGVKATIDGKETNLTLPLKATSKAQYITLTAYKLWGDVPWEFDDTTGTLTFLSGGDLADYSQSPWNRTGNYKIDSTLIKKIVFTKSVNAPKNSNYLFSSVIASGTGAKYLTNLTSIERLDFLNVSQVETMNSMFYNTGNLKTLDVSNWDTSKVTDMESMFFNANSLVSLDVSNWDISNVININSLFYGASSLVSLDVSNWDTSNIENMNSMFYGSRSLVSLDVSKWDTSKVTNMGYMFYNTLSLMNLDVSEWNTSSLTIMYDMFNNARSLTSLNLAKWDTSNVTQMQRVFYDTINLESLDITNFDTIKTLSVSNMFKNANKLSSLTIGKKFKDSEFKSGLVNVPNNENYIGQWIHKDSQTLVGQSDVFMKNYDGSRPGTYIWSPPVAVDVTIKYINKETNKEIYEQIETKKIKEKDTFTISMGKSVKENLDDLVTNNQLTLDYEGYQPITTDDYVVVDTNGNETKPTTTPREEFTIIFYYTGSLYIKEAPNISFGEVTRTLLGKTSMKPVKAAATNDLVLVNTTNQDNWKLTASLPKGIYNQTDNTVKLQSNLIFKKPANTGNVTLNALPDEVATNNELTLDPLGKVDLDASFQLDVFSKNDVGDYTGSVLWSIDRVP